MKSLFVSFAVAVAALFSFASSARCQSIVVQKDWSLISSMSTNGPIDDDGSTFFYETSIPWKVDWNSSPSPYQVPYAVRAIRDGAPIADLLDNGYVPGNSSGTNSYSTPTGMTNSIELEALGFHPLYYPIPLIIVAQDSDTSGTDELQINIGDFSGDIPISRNDAKGYGRDLAEALADALVDGAITSQVQQGLMMQHSLTQMEVDAYISQFKSGFENLMGGLTDGAVDAIFDAEHPTNVIRMGTGSPFKSAMEDALDGVPGGLLAGYNGLGIGDVLNIQFDTSGINAFLTNAINTLIQTGQLPPANQWADKVWISEFGLDLPIILQTTGVSINGGLSIAGTNISFTQIGGLSISSNFGVEGSVGGWDFTLGVSMERQYDLQENEWSPFSAGLSGTIVLP